MLKEAANDEEDSFDGDLDQDPDDIKEVDVARLRIRQLTHERERSDDYEKRLSRKLQKLDADLAARREEVEGLQRSLLLERNKFQEEYNSEKRERETKALTQEDRIRDQLTEVLYAKAKSTGKKGGFELDTVLVSFVKPNDSLRYNLAFRIDGGTTILQLRNSACKYWGVNPDNFILRTMANNKCQDDNNVKECFKQGEIAQLRLEMKRESAEPPLEEELKAIQPKRQKRAGRSKGGKPKYNAEGVDKIQKFGDNYSSQLKKMGGIFFLLKLRDSKPSEHATKIKLRDVIVYTALVALTFYVYVARRPGGEAYWCAKGIQDYMLMSMPKDTSVQAWSCSGDGSLDDSTSCVPGFEDVKSHDDLWDWLNYTVPSIFWRADDKPQLATYNRMLGYLSIRVQNVKQPEGSEFCINNNARATEALDNITTDKNITCYARKVDPSNDRDTDFTDISSYWGNVSQESAADLAAVVRGVADPGKWRSAEENSAQRGIGSISADLGNYDPSGFSVDYRMTITKPENGTADYRQDLDFFRQHDWIGITTRAVVVSFTAYNYHYDLFTASDFLFEVPPSGDILPSYTVKPFRPRIHETRSELTHTYIDYARLCIGIYILVFVGFFERQHKVKNHKAGFYYHISLNGITDLGLVSCMFITAVWRTVVFQIEPTWKYMARAQDSLRIDGFYSFRWDAEQYNMVFNIDGMMMVFVMYRMISFFRLNHTIYLLWHALGEALKMLLFFGVVFLPATAGFVIVSNALLGPYLFNFASLADTAVMAFRSLAGEMSPQMVDRDIMWSLASTGLLYLFVTFFLANIFIMILVDAYYVVRLTSPQPTEKWDSSRIRSWALPGVCISIFQAVLAPGTTEGRD